MFDWPQLAQKVVRARPALGEAERRRLTGLHDIPALVALTLGVLAITSLPYLFAYLTAPPDRHFVGILFGVPDTMQYFSWLRDHHQAWFVANRMTPEPNEPALFNLLWIGVGWVGSLTNWSYAALFQGLRLLTGATLLLVLFVACARFTRGRAERWTAFLVATLGGGLGWVWVVDKYLNGLADVRFPFDLYVAEPNTLFIVLAFPHFAIATTLILAVFLCFLEALERRTWLYTALGAALGLLLTLQHAYDLLIIGLVPAGALALMLVRDRRIPWRGAVVLAVIGTLALPPPLYFTWLTSRDPLWREVLSQFANAGVYTPPPQHLLLLMGIPLILTLAAALAALTGVARNPARLALPADNADLLLWSWLVVGFLLLYVPTDFQIHMLNAWQVPLAILTARWLHRHLMPALATRRPALARVLPALLVLLVLPTNLYLLAWRVYDLSRYEAPFYLTSDEGAALAWLENTADADTVVLSGLTLGQFVPVYSDARTFLGHWAQTAHFYEKREQVQAFFTPSTSEDTRLALLQAFKINYVIHGAEERALGTYDPAASSLLELAFERGDVRVFRVRPAPAGQ
jgi:hypothetical protein